jgi:CelD/BcsL family acetyltransferase involved in cellulose biosynthesis
MEINVIPGRNLDAALVRAWTEIQLANPELVSPYFAPEFTQAIAAAMDGVEVAVIHEAGSPAALFPFERIGGRLGAPVGRSLCVYQGLICRPGFTCNARELVRQCGLDEWKFDALIATQTSFTRFHHVREPSPQMDLSRGYDAYAAERRAAGSELIKKCANLMRRIEREVGPLRFVAHSSDATLLQQTLAWKSQQYIETGVPDSFVAGGWMRTVVEQIHGKQTENFAGMLSLLFAGDRLVAGHFGTRSRSELQYMLPAYDKGMSKYSPGLILLLKMAEHAPSLGLRTIDLGRGMHSYKERLMNGAVTLAAGSVEMPSLGFFCRAANRKLRAMVKGSPLGNPARQLVRWIRAARSSS